jgi:hypothetical protein
MSLSEILTLMTAATSAAVAIINALKHRSTAQKVDTTLDIMAQTQGTVNKVQSLVNGQSEALKNALLHFQERCRALEAELARPPRATQLAAARPRGGEPGAGRLRLSS